MDRGKPRGRGGPFAPPAPRCTWALCSDAPACAAKSSRLSSGASGGGSASGQRAVSTTNCSSSIGIASAHRVDSGSSGSESGAGRPRDRQPFHPASRRLRAGVRRRGPVSGSRREPRTAAAVSRGGVRPVRIRRARTPPDRRIRVRTRCCRSTSTISSTSRRDVIRPPSADVRSSVDRSSACLRPSRLRFRSLGDQLIGEITRPAAPTSSTTVNRWAIVAAGRLGVLTMFAAE